jgi:hypothetical protein
MNPGGGDRRVGCTIFTVSDRRLPFSSPPTSRRTTVEVVDPASTRVYSLLESELLYDWQFSANQLVLASSPLRLTAGMFFLN